MYSCISKYNLKGSGLICSCQNMNVEEINTLILINKRNTCLFKTVTTTAVLKIDGGAHSAVSFKVPHMSPARWLQSHRSRGRNVTLRPGGSAEHLIRCCDEAPVELWHYKLGGGEGAPQMSCSVCSPQPDWSEIQVFCFFLKPNGSRTCRWSRWLCGGMLKIGAKKKKKKQRARLEMLLMMSSLLTIHTDLLWNCDREIRTNQIISQKDAV